MHKRGLIVRLRQSLVLQFHNLRSLLRVAVIVLISPHAIGRAYALLKGAWYA